MVLASPGMARKLSNENAQLAVPASVLDLLDRDANAGSQLACELAEGVRASGAFDGVHLVPVSRYREVALLLEQQGWRRRYVTTRLGSTVDHAGLNRALLERQLLLARSRFRAGARARTSRRDAGAGTPRARTSGCGPAIDGFQPDALAVLIEQRSTRYASRSMRGTLHLVTARDCLWLRAVTQPVLERGFWVGSPFGRRLEGFDIDAVLASGARSWSRPSRAPPPSWASCWGRLARPRCRSLGLRGAVSVAAGAGTATRASGASAGPLGRPPSSKWLDRPVATTASVDRAGRCAT